MNFNQRITRRESIRKLLQLSGSLALSGAAAWSIQSPLAARAASEKKKFMVEGLGQTEKYDVKELTRRTFEAAGGMNRFVSKGDVVVVKPIV